MVKKHPLLGVSLITFFFTWGIAALLFAFPQQLAALTMKKVNGRQDPSPQNPDPIQRRSGCANSSVLARVCWPETKDQENLSNSEAGNGGIGFTIGSSTRHDWRQD